jgi:RHS repeat-associated protein
LPPLKFSYQQMDFRFLPPVPWGPVLTPEIGTGNAEWHSIRAVVDGGKSVKVDLLDLNGDGLPDRVMRNANTPYDRYVVQFNTGSGFTPTNLWGPLIPPGRQTKVYFSGKCQTVTETASSATNRWGWIGRSDDDPAHTYLSLLDINGDGRPDRLMRQALSKYCSNNVAYTRPFTNLVVQFNDGTNFAAEIWAWGPTTNALSDTSAEWNAITKGSKKLAQMTLDINGDGLPDRVMWAGTNNATVYKLQLNTGKGFSATLFNLGTLNNDGRLADDYDRVQRMWVDAESSKSATLVRLQDINGDGLPDRLMAKNVPAGAETNLFIQLNHGVEFGQQTTWGPLRANVRTGKHVIHFSDNGKTHVELLDINGDGLPDRVTAFNTNTTMTAYQVQLNTGSGFGPVINWTGLDNQGGPAKNWLQVRGGNSEGTIYQDLIDINGDGLPDRVMRKVNEPYTNFVVQLNAGPFPDLMNRIDNSIGGSVLISYKPSTVYTNTGGDGIPDLPYPVYTVASVSVTDGLGNTNTTTYSYRDGYHDWTTPEFRGFNRVEVTDPLGTKTITYFHQGRQSTKQGARTPDGHFTDEMAKKGIPYRVEVWGNDDKKYSQTISVVAVTNTHSSSSTNCWFPFVARTVNYEFEGLATPRMTATEFQYNPQTGDILKQSSLGEVEADLNTGAITNLRPGDEVYTHTTYISFPNVENVTRPDAVWTSTNPNPDRDGPDTLRKTLFEYDTLSRLRKSLRWIEGSNYATNTINAYDDFGNPTSATDAAGITTRTEYDSIYRLFPVKTITATFTNTATYDARSGQTLTATDAKGLVVTNAYDEFYRIKQTGVYTNDASFAWLKIYDYNLNGFFGGQSRNWVRSKINDGFTTPSDSKWKTATYFDGLGRTIQTKERSERTYTSESTFWYRTVDVQYDARGKVRFQSLPYFSGSYSNAIPPRTIGTTTEYDPIGRVKKVTPPGGDEGSPTGPETIAYIDGSNPWATVTTDAEGKVKKSFHDAYGRVRQIVEVTSEGNFTTQFDYDPLGNLIKVTDHAGNQTTMVYDALGRKKQMTDPDMGTWRYFYDAAGRMTEQIDAKGQKLKFYYDDEIGRLRKKEIYNSAGSLVATVTYTYDVSDDPNFTVFKGQLYKVSDRQGWQKNSYDRLGRVLKTRRHLDVNNQDYDTETKYDLLDRPTEVTYPGKVTRIKYSYDIGGNLNRVESTCGTGSNEIFYRAGAFNELGQLTSYTNGNGVVTSYSYYDNSKRLRQIQSLKGSTNLQQLAYSYDKVSNIKSINDLAYRGQSGDATLTAIQYDDLHRLKSYTRGATPFNFQYNAIGNITKNPEFGGGTYTYGSSKPHAVTSANGKTYAYDANGNMTNRNGQVLIYDEENQLVEVRNTDGKIIRFGYSDGGARLWQQVTEGGTTRTTIWIGGIYELKDGKTLCHVFADGRRLATFQPQGALCAFIQRTPLLAASQKWLKLATTWPFSEGRTPLTVCLFPLFGILAASMWGRRRKVDIPSLSRNLSCFGFGLAHRRRISRLPLRPYPRWMQIISVLLIVALFVAVTPTEVQAQVCEPIFWYYHSDHLGSSNILTDRSGNVVKHYEYTAFGQDRSPAQQPCAFNVSHRYTGQIFDEATGLYYYNARYYDPELGRFIQPDTIVPSAGDPQTLNRYSYVRNNPLIYVDPTGNDFGLSILIGTLIGATLGAVQSAVTGGNIWQGLLIGAAAGFVGGAVGGAAFANGSFWGQGFFTNALGAELGKSAAALYSSVVTGAAAGAAGGATSAALNGGNFGQAIAQGAGIGALSGATFWFAGPFGPVHALPGFGRVFANPMVASVSSSAVASAVTGDDVGLGAGLGALGATINFGFAVAEAWGKATRFNETNAKAGDEIYYMPGDLWGWVGALLTGTPFSHQAMAATDITAGEGKVWDLARPGALGEERSFASSLTKRAEKAPESARRVLVVNRNLTGAALRDFQSRAAQIGGARAGGLNYTCSSYCAAIFGRREFVPGVSYIRWQYGL